MHRLLSLILAFFATSALAVDIPVRNPSSGGSIYMVSPVRQQKQYVVGTAYTNGTPSATSGQAGFTVSRAVLIPYQTSNGVWRLRGNGSFNITAVNTTAAGSIYSYSTNFTISGVTFRTGSSLYQPGAAMGSNASWIPSGCYMSPGSGTIVVTLLSTAVASMQNYAVSFDAELDSKPTWAD